MPDQLWKVVLFMLGSIVIIFGAYYTTYYLGKRAMKMRPGRNIILHDRFALSKDRSICLVQIKEKVYVVAFANQSVTLLDTLSADAFAVDEPDPFVNIGLKEGLAKVFSAMRGQMRKQDTESRKGPGARSFAGRDGDFENLYRERKTAQYEGGESPGREDTE